MAINKSSLAKLIPNSTKVNLGGGKEIVLAGNEEENKILNFLLAAKIRDFFDSALQKYFDNEDKPSPKDLKDIAEAGRILAEFSAQIYKEGAGPSRPEEKQVTPSGVTIPDFGNIKEEQPKEEPK